MMMNKLIFAGFLLLFSCSNSVKQQKDYDAVMINEYKNTYDNKGRLSKVIITVTKGMYSGDNGLEDKTVRIQQYSYKDDTDYLIDEITGVLGEQRLIKYTRHSKEEILLKNEKDTLEYSYERYYNCDKDKSEYSKMMWRSYDNPSVQEGFEDSCFYDTEGNRIKSIYKSFDTNEVSETYYFDGITYEEALLRIPKSADKPDIICSTKSVVNDTVIIRTTLNGELEDITKEYTDKSKKIKRQYDRNGILDAEWVDYVEDGLKISASNYQRPDGFRTDSVFYKNDRKLRKVEVDSNRVMKMITNSEYDDKGNLLKEVTKIVHSRF